MVITKRLIKAKDEQNSKNFSRDIWSTVAENCAINYDSNLNLLHTVVNFCWLR